MNTKMKAVWMSVLVVLLGIIATGCGTNHSEKTVDLAFVGGGHGNMPVFSADCKAVHESLYNTAYTHGEVTMLSCDGSPTVFFQATIPEPSTGGLSKNKQRYLAEEYVTQLQTAYGEVGPSAPEVNTLKAITMASRALSGTEGQKKVLLVVDNGLQTTGYLNFSNGKLLNADPQDIVKALSDLEALPRFEDNTEVVWMGLGSTIAPQEELSERQLARLKKTWECILYAAGAQSVTWDNGNSTNMPYDGAPSVTTVPVEEQTINVNVSEQAADPIKTIILDSTRLDFVGDKALFVSEKEARRVLSDVARELIDNPDNHVYVIGTTAGNKTDDFAKSLSEARANIVKDQLINLGVPENQMTARGLGSGDPWHENDIDANGDMIEEVARKNRKTIIMDTNSSEAQLLL